jgi:hypothetical protein
MSTSTPPAQPQKVKKGWEVPTPIVTPFLSHSGSTAAYFRVAEKKL